MENFGTVIEFSLAGFQDDKILRQWIESPANPIVHPLIDRPAATFVTRHAGDGRVDNVLLSIKSKSQSKTDRVAVVPKIHILTCERLELLYRPHSYGPRPGQQIAHACRRAAQQQSRELHVVGRGGIHSLSTAWRSVRRGVGTLFRPVATRKTNQPKPSPNICTMPKCFWTKLASSGGIGSPLEPRTGAARVGTGRKKGSIPSPTPVFQSVRQSCDPLVIR
jgi:hypothetical protein